MNFNYNKMLEKALNNSSIDCELSDRFEPPEVSIQEDGSHVIYKNFKQTAQYINREIDEILTFFKEELATNASLDDKKRARFKGNFSQNELEIVLEEYISLFVKCNQCGSPDTVYNEQKGIEIIRCDACGATNPKP